MPDDLNDDLNDELNEERHNELIDACTRISKRIPTWTQGAGGNVSIKDSDVLQIKASGKRLDQVTEKKGIAEVRLAEIQRGLPGTENENQYFELLKATAKSGPDLGFPSMETGFHATLPKKVVAHFHALSAILMAHYSKSDPNRWTTWLKSLNAIPQCEILPYATPGLKLSQLISNYTQLEFLILTNHGVVIQGDNLAILARWQEFEERFCENFGCRELLSSHLNRAFIATPLKQYFPDVAVFSKELLEILEPDPSSKAKAETYLFPFSADASPGNIKNLSEIWHATQILYFLCPSLEEIPEWDQKNLGALPTEQLRKKP